MRFIQALVFLVLQTSALGRVLSSKKSKKSNKGGDDENILRAVINTYPDYPGVLDPSGSVTLRFNPDGSFWTTLNVNGLKTVCENCGVHVHEGTSCDHADSPGGNYWNTDRFDSNPWKSVFYSTTQSGATTSGFYMNNGFDFVENDGHAFVIHTQGGVRVGCGVLNGGKRFSLKTNDIGPYPEYDGTLKPKGSVQVDFLEDDSFKYSYKMSGLPRNCENCGVHIHQGITCDDPTAGHYYSNEVQVEDPWTSASGASYNSDKTGNAEGFFYLSSGLNYEENIGHAVVFHDSSGTRVACGVLEEVVEMITA